MKYLFLLLSLVACSSNSDFAAGDCVRVLGDATIEKVTIITKSGAVETEWTNEYTGSLHLSAYDAVQATKLVKVNCIN